MRARSATKANAKYVQLGGTARLWNAQRHTARTRNNTAAAVPSHWCTETSFAGKSFASVLFHHHPAMTVSGVMAASKTIIHNPAAYNDCRRKIRPSRSLKNARGSRAAVKFTRMGWISSGLLGGDQRRLA